MMRAMWFRAALAAVVVAALAGCRQGPAARGDTDGETLYYQLCSRCHGPEGTPTDSMVARHGVKDLTADEVQSEMTDDEIREQIMRGSDNRQMPAFGGAITDEQVDAIVEYVRTLSR